MRLFLYICAVALGLSGLLLAATGCSTTGPDVPTVLSQPVDSAVQQQTLAAHLHNYGRLKIKGPVTIQLGGVGNTATSTNAAKAKAPVAAAPHAQATDASKHAGGPAWWVYVLIGAVSIVAWEWLSHRALNLSWLPTRRPATEP